ncbi:MAG: DUF2141 domain-containing protein [Limnohabitans sp.]|nr:DUF2141 domain-containing protein [Limnohabitans sp.]
MRKNILAFIMLASVGVFAQEAKVNLKIKISGFKNNNGKVMVGLYDSEGTFLKKSLKGAKAKIEGNSAYVVFEGLTKGEYAFSLFHDENNNNELDKNFIGIPKEDYVASNNARGMMGPPKYNDAKFNLSQSKEIQIKF